MQKLFGTILKDVGTKLLLRGNKEMTELKWSHFKFGTAMSGPLAGAPLVTFDQGMGDKTRKLDLRNPFTRSGERKLRYIHNENEPKDMYFKILKYRQMCPPSQIRFFCHSMSANQMQKAVKSGLNWKVNPNRPIGKNALTTFSPMLCQAAGLSKIIGNHSWRAFGITKLANAPDVSLEESMYAARHASASTHAMYQRPSDLSEFNRLNATSSVSYPRRR